MSDESGAPALLVVAADRELRARLETVLGASFRTAGARPDDLRDRVRWLDTCAGVAVLDGRAGEEGLAGLERLREIPAGRSLVLLARDADDELLQLALSRLSPRQLLLDPAPEAALRWAAQQVMPPDPAGEGARRGQRRAASLLGVSGAIREVLEQVQRVAPSGVPVLILGETGTGKELVARSLHEQSPRRNRSFVAVNCGALPEALLEGELFGFQRGAFTGAQRDKMGLFEQADGGTLFLDEVGDTSAALQVKLLRALESGEIRRLGDTRDRKVDVRLVSATHRDLESLAEEGGFRHDLLYRMNTVTLTVPPLRRRRVDIPFLAQHFAEELGERQARRITLDDAFLEALARHDFPGNVRELRNAVERAIALAQPGSPVSADHLPERVRGATRPALPVSGSLKERVEEVERAAIQEALEASGGNRTHAAEALGLSRVGLRQKMRRLGLENAGRR